jgi:hypothetical protein
MARTHVLDRWPYRGRRAHWLARRINGATAQVAAAGRGPSQLYMLEVRGRRPGNVIRFPVVVDKAVQADCAGSIPVTRSTR